MTDLTSRIPTDINELIDMFGLTQPGVGINGALLRRLREQEGQERSLALWREACSIAQKRLDALVVADESDGDRPTFAAGDAPAEETLTAGGLRSRRTTPTRAPRSSGAGPAGGPRPSRRGRRPGPAHHDRRRPRGDERLPGRHRPGMAGPVPASQSGRRRERRATASPAAAGRGTRRRTAGRPHRYLHLRSPDLAARPGLRPVAPRQLGHHLPAPAFDHHVKGDSA